MRVFANLRGATLLVLVLLGPAMSLAAVHNGTIQGDEAQAESCFVGSVSQSLGTVTYDDVSGLFTWSYTYGDNAPAYDDGDLFGGGSEIVSHFHGPALPGVPGTIQIATTVGTPSSGSSTIASEDGADLLADLWYLNIHTTACASGEVRGQVLFPSNVPSFSGPAIVLLVAVLGLSAVMLRGRFARRG